MLNKRAGSGGNQPSIPTQTSEGETELSAQIDCDGIGFCPDALLLLVSPIWRINQSQTT